MKPPKYPALTGIILGNQLVALIMFFINWINKGLNLASSVYGLTTLIIVYPTLIVFLITKFVKELKKEIKE